MKELTRTDLIKIAVIIINEVMDENQKEKGDSWTAISVEEHYNHAIVNLVKGDCLGKENLKHALTRLAMVATLLFKDDYKAQLIGGGNVKADEFNLVK